VTDPYGKCPPTNPRCLALIIGGLGLLKDAGTAWLPAAGETAKDVFVGGGKLATAAVYGALNKVSLGGMSRLEANLETFAATEGTLAERLNAAGRAGDEAALNSVTIGYYGADDKWQHTKDLVGGVIGERHYEIGISDMYEGYTTGDVDRFMRGASELTMGVSQTTLAVAGTAEAGAQGLKLLRSARVPKTPDFRTGQGFGAGDSPVRIEGEWSLNDMKQGLLGKTPRGLGKPDLHHGGQMPGAARHEILPGQHRNNPALHPNARNQGVTPEMRQADRQLHWWYRAREQGADKVLPDWIYDD
jgi:hypothetical protein